MIPEELSSGARMRSVVSWALIGLMVYSFARIGAAIGMRVDDVYAQNRRLWVRLHEKGQAARHALPS